MTVQEGADVPSVPEDEDLRTAFADAVDRTVGDEEIAPKLADPGVGVSEADLRAHIEASAGQAWAAVAEELQDYTEARREQTRRLVRTITDVTFLLVPISTIASIVIHLVAPPLWLAIPPASITALAIAQSFTTLRLLYRRARDTASAARKRLRIRLYLEGVKPLARELFPQAAWALEMKRGPTPGLAELSSTRFEVSTQSRDDLRHLLSQLRGGAIGVSGPRGAGKTSLIGSVCSGRTKVVEGDQIGITVSAPVHYDARDFVIHLLTRACERAMTSPRAVQWERSRAFRDLEAMERRRRVGLLATVGIVLFVAGMLSDLKIDVTKGEERTVFLWSLAAIAVTLASLTAFTDVLRRVPLTSWTRAPTFTGSPFSQAAQRLTWSLMQRLRPKGTVGGDTVAERAQELYRETKFQQSFSSGWSGSLKLPPGIGLGTDSKLSWAQVQMSLPELVEQLRDFLQFIVEQRRVTVIVGIDELDKIGSKEDARAFLNGIKAVFGIPGVFFLVSVSQDAMSSFERRGLPFRDVFDSSFDEIVKARYLALPETERLLRRRVIGMPSSFHALCHCLAGGLPRDVIRVARSLMDHVARSPKLAACATALVSEEIAEKCHATAIAAKTARPAAAREELLEQVAKFEVTEVTAAGLHAAYRNFSSSPAARIERAADSDDEDVLQIADLAHELATFVLFCATLLDVFGPGVTEKRLERASETRLYGLLAEARQAFALDPSVARRCIDELRMLPPIAPGAAQAPAAVIAAD